MRGGFTQQKGIIPLRIIVLTGFILLITVGAKIIDSNNTLFNKVFDIKTPGLSPDLILPTRYYGLSPEVNDKSSILSTLTPTPTPVPVQIHKLTNQTISEGELISAINAYRQAHGLSTLSTNSALCDETRKRVQDMVRLNVGRAPADIILNHDGMAQDVADGTLANHVGKRSYGENIASAYCKRPSDNTVVDITTGVQLVEWCFDSSAGHRENLLRPDWTDVCSSGQFPFYVETFAK